MPVMGYIGIGIAVFVLLILIVAYAYWKKLTATCPECGHTWSPKFFKLLFGLHGFKGNRLICPQCNQQNMIVLKRQKKRAKGE